MKVETYIPIDSAYIKLFLSTGDKSKIQGSSILLGYDSYAEETIRPFLEAVLHDVNKIVIEKSIKRYYLVAQKIEEDIEEPFANLIDIHANLQGDIDAITDFICTFSMFEFFYYCNYGKYRFFYNLPGF